MTLYTVLAPPAHAGETQPDPIGLVFIKEGFCWPALFVPALWLIYRRMWLVLLFFIAALVGINVLAARTTEAIGAALSILGVIWFAVEANGLRRWSYMIRGWRLIDVVEGRTFREAELRYFLAWPEAAPPAPPPPPAEKPRVRLPSIEQGDVVGLFPAPGGAP